MLEVHWICELMVPSCASVAVAENVTESPSMNSEPVDGELIDTVGRVFVPPSEITVNVICSLS